MFIYRNKSSVLSLLCILSKAEDAGGVDDDDDDAGASLGTVSIIGLT